MMKSDENMMKHDETMRKNVETCRKSFEDFGFRVQKPFERYPGIQRSITLCALLLAIIASACISPLESGSVNLVDSNDEYHDSSHKQNMIWNYPGN